MVVGNIAAPCNLLGLAFDKHGTLFIADSGRIVTLRPSTTNPPTATVYATDLPGANGVAFDRNGRLWVSDGSTAQGRVWRIGSDRMPIEVFRVQPMANDVNLDATGTGGVGRDHRAIWRASIDHKGRLQSPTGCDPTFTSNTLCLDNVLVAHPYLEGVDGIVLDRAGNIVSAVNERNAVVVVTTKDRTVELFRNPIATTGCATKGRSSSPPAR